MPLQWKKAGFVSSLPHAVGRLQCRLPRSADGPCPSLHVSVSHILLGPGSLPPARKNSGINSAPVRSQLDPPQAVVSSLGASGCWRSRSHGKPCPGICEQSGGQKLNPPPNARPNTIRAQSLGWGHNDKTCLLDFPVAQCLRIHLPNARDTGWIPGRGRSHTPRSN